MAMAMETPMANEADEARSSGLTDMGVLSILGCNERYGRNLTPSHPASSFQPYSATCALQRDLPPRAYTFAVSVAREPRAIAYSRRAQHAYGSRAARDF